MHFEKQRMLRTAQQQQQQQQANMAQGQQGGNGQNAANGPKSGQGPMQINVQSQNGALQAQHQQPLQPPGPKQPSPLTNPQQPGPQTPRMVQQSPSMAMGGQMQGQMGNQGQVGPDQNGQVCLEYQPVSLYSEGASCGD